jgi:hypothetical protein
MQEPTEVSRMALGGPPTFTRRMMFSLMRALTSSRSSAEHSLLYLEFPAGWKGERKLRGLPLWWIGKIDNGEWVIYSSLQYFQVGQSDVIPFSFSIGKFLIMWEDF